MRSLLVLGGLLLVAVDAHAEAPACGDHERALSVMRAAATLMRASDAKPLATRATVDTTIPSSVRQSVQYVACSESALTSAELLTARDFEQRASSWADASEKAMAAEQETRDSIVLPMCEAVWGRDQAQAALDHEKANPSGVVNLRALHDAGAAVQYWTARVAEIAPSYETARHHRFVSWQDEGACVAAAHSPTL